MSIVTSILDHLIGPAIAVGKPLTRYEAMQPEAGRKDKLDFEPYLCH